MVYLTSATFDSYVKTFLNDVRTSLKLFTTLHTLDSVAFAFFNTPPDALLAGAVVQCISLVTPCCAFAIVGNKLLLFTVLVFLFQLMARSGRETTLFILQKGRDREGFIWG